MSLGISKRLLSILGFSEDMNWGFRRGGGGGAESGGAEQGDETEQAATPDQVYDSLLERNDVLAFQTRKMEGNQHSNRRASESFDEDTSTALICNKLVHEYAMNKSLVAQNRIKSGEMGIMSELKSQVELAKESFKYAALSGRPAEELSEVEFNNKQAIDFLDKAVHNIPDARTAQRFVEDYDKRHSSNAGAR